jgi:hypothetical protein
MITSYYSTQFLYETSSKVYTVLYHKWLTNTITLHLYQLLTYILINIWYRTVVRTW